MPGLCITRRVLLSQLAACGVAVAQQEAYSTDLLSTGKREHPRLILPDSELGRIRALTVDHPLARKLRANLVQSADRLLTAPPVEYKLVANRLIVQSRKVLERIYTLALLDRLENNPQYKQRAVNELRAAALFPNWNSPHFLDVAEMTHAFAIGYDWLYPYLAEADRDWIRGALVEKGLDVALAAYREPAPWVTQDTAVNLICNSAAAMGALAVAVEEPELARKVLGSAVRSIHHGLALYAPDGAFPEGPGYWNYGTRYVAHLLSSLESAVDGDLGLSRARGLDRTGRFRIYVTGPSGKTFNFGESGDEAGTAPEMFWLARRFNQPVYAWQEQIQAGRSGHVDPLDLVWFYKDARKPQADEWPLETIFAGSQLAFFRAAWDDASAIYLGVKGGDNKSAHAHLDLGSFVLDAGGIRWVYDSESDPATAAHNAVLIDGQNQNRKAEARILGHEFGPELSWVHFDLAACYPGKVKRFERKIGVVQKQAVAIQDVLTADEPVEAVWGIMTDAEISIKGQTAELRKADWVLDCEIQSPRHAVFDVLGDPNTKRLVARVGSRVTDLELNILMTPHRASQPKPVVTNQLPR